MFGKTILTIAAAVGIATAQTAPGFPVPASQSLVVRYGNNTVSPAGEMIPRPGMSCSLPSLESPTHIWVQKLPVPPTSALQFGGQQKTATTRLVSC